MSYCTRAEILIYLKYFFSSYSTSFLDKYPHQFGVTGGNEPIIVLKFLFSDKVTYLLSKLTTYLCTPKDTFAKVLMRDLINTRNK
jgi:hypothetical protein